MNGFTFSIPQNIIFGKGSLKQLPEAAKKLNKSKALIISGPHLNKIGMVAACRQALEEAGIRSDAFTETEGNPSTETVDRAVERYKESGADFIVAFGGGSPLDVAKAVAVLATYGGKITEYEGGGKVPGPVVPMIAVPTTAGTGSETTIAAVITNEKTHHKHAIMDLCLVPRFAVLDAMLTEDLPPATTAQTGMDALTHAVEAYVSVHCTTKETDRCAEEATAAIFQNLERAYRNGHDLEARQEMLLASFKAGVAFTRAGVGNVHAIAHTLGGLYNTPHGLANAVILPYVLEDYGAAAEKKLARLAELTGVKATCTAHEKSAAFIAEIRAMNRRMGIPEHIDSIREEDIPQMVAWALKEANPTYPVPVLYDAARCETVIRRVRGV